MTGLRVDFSFENVEWGPDELLGLHTLASGLSYLGLTAGGDWEYPVFFLIYFDGRRLRSYVPTRGNPWNTTTRRAYGNDGEADLKNAKRRWPERFANATEVEADDFEWEPKLILEEINERFRERKSRPQSHA